ncbi:MAG: VTT domain-containing protein [Candidatus Omnitrophica bacterium]|nr:VTT domain-containing protein [Candidatus Omnitrophota bacterium]
MTELHLSNELMALISRYGDIGLLLGMFLESSIVPIPSEVIIAGAGAIGIPLISILIFGSLGSTLGAIVGYAIGKYAAMPLILKFGKYAFLKPHHFSKAEAFAKKYGVPSVFIGRLIPIIPFKVFSITAGVTKIPFIPFVFCTLLGVLPRILILAVFGSTIVRYTKPVVLGIIGIALIFLAVKLTNKIFNGARSKVDVT